MIIFYNIVLPVSPVRPHPVMSQSCPVKSSPELAMSPAPVLAPKDSAEPSDSMAMSLQ